MENELKKFPWKQKKLVCLYLEPKLYKELTEKIRYGGWKTNTSWFHDITEAFIQGRLFIKKR